MNLGKRDKWVGGDVDFNLSVFSNYLRVFVLVFC